MNGSYKNPVDYEIPHSYSPQKSYYTKIDYSGWCCYFQTVVRFIFYSLIAWLDPSLSVYVSSVDV